MIVYESLFSSYKGECKFNESLANYTSFNIGGPADVFASVKTRDELISLLKIISKNKIPYFIIGNGTNLLVSDKGFRGVVIKLCDEFSFVSIEDKSPLSPLNKGEIKVVAGAGTSLSQLISTTMQCGLVGLECLAGIPGTVGGAIKMNAGTSSGWILDFTKKVNGVDVNGNEVSYNIEVSLYRKSNLPSDFIITDAELILKKGDTTKAEEKIQNYLKRRRETQPISIPNAGCVFKNPPNDSAGRIIDELGLKGTSVGDAEVSKKHANFIVNQNKAKAEDVWNLIKLVKEKVKKERDIELELEIQLVGDFS